MDKLYKDLTQTEKMKILSKIEFNVKAEAEAREFYYDLLEILPIEQKSMIKEIIRDELDHSIILR